MNGTIKITLRNLPKPLHAALKKIALTNRHSLNDEVVIAIEGHVERIDGAKVRAELRRYGHSEDCPWLHGGKCVYPCHMQPADSKPEKPAPKRARGER